MFSAEQIEAAAHHSCGFLFRILHDDGNLLLDVTDKTISDAWLRVQNGATNVDAGQRREFTLFVTSAPDILLSYYFLPNEYVYLFVVFYICLPGWVLQRVQIPAL